MNVIYLWLDTSVEYEFRDARNVQMKLQSGNRIDEGSVIYISRHDKGG